MLPWALRVLLRVRGGGRPSTPAIPRGNANLDACRRWGPRKRGPTSAELTAPETRSATSDRPLRVGREVGGFDPGTAIIHHPRAAEKGYGVVLTDP